MTRPAPGPRTGLVPALVAVTVLLAACGSAPRASLGAGGATPGSAGGTGASPPSSGSGTSTGGTAGVGGSAGSGSSGTGTAVTAPVVTDGSTTTTAGAPRTTTTLAPPRPPSGTGAYGYVTAGPTCPVEQAGNPCPPQPVSASVSAQDGSGRSVAVTRTDSSGRYALSLPPGSYTLVADPGSSWPRCQPAQVTVAAGAPTRADISCDTGIR